MTGYVPREADHLSPLLSLVFVIVGAGLPCLWLIGMALRGIAKNWRLAASAERPDAHFVSRRGHVAVRGTVVVAPALKHAMRIEIDLVGSEWRVKNGYQHKWEETERRVSCSPFSVKTDSGKMVEVKATEQTLLVDKLDQLRRHARDRRTQSAELSPGERVYVVGELRQEVSATGEFVDFREPPAPKWVLYATLLSTEPIENKFLDRVRFYTHWLLLSLLATALVHGLALSGYYLRLLRGEVVSAPVQAKRFYVTGSGKSRSTHRDVRIEIGEGQVVTEQASRSSYDRITVGQAVPVIVVRDYPSLTQLGDEPTVDGWAWGVPAFSLLLMGAVFWARRTQTRPWFWQRKLVIEGGGPL